MQQASFGSRVGALIIDWGLCMLLAWALLGPAAVSGGGWRRWATLALFWIEKTVLTASLGGSAGQLMSRLGVMRTDGRRIGWAASAARALGTCVAIPAVVSHDGRSLLDTLLGTVVVKRR